MTTTNSPSSSFSSKVHQYVLDPIINSSCLSLCGGGQNNNTHEQQEFIGDDATWSGLEYEVVSDEDDNFGDDDILHQEEKQFFSRSSNSSSGLGGGGGSGGAGGLPMLRQLPSFGTTPYNYRSTSNGRGKVRKNSTATTREFDDEEVIIKTGSKAFGDMQRLHHKPQQLSSSEVVRV